MTHPNEPSVIALRKAKIQDARLTRANRARNVAQRSINLLTRLAGDHDEIVAGYAISVLFHLLTNAVGNFHHNAESAVLSERHRESTPDNFQTQPHRQRQFERLARYTDHWPVLYHAHAEKRANVENLVRTLHLAEDLGLNYSGKSFSFLTPANVVVLRFYEFIERFRGREAETSISILNGRTLPEAEQEQLRLWVKGLCGLPKLSRKPEVLKKWRKRGEELLPVFYGKEFQVHPDLRRFTKGAERTKSGGPARWSERKRVKEALEAAWTSIARGSGGE